LKKILVYVLILSMIASMHVGCNQSSNQINNQDSNESSNQAPSDSSAIKFKAGTYVGESEGMKGPIKVQVTVDEEKIKEVKILEHVDSERLFNYANESIPAAIVENQSVAVDAVAGATMSSIGIIGAAKKALSQSGADLKLLDVKKEKRYEKVYRKYANKTGISFNRCRKAGPCGYTGFINHKRRQLIIQHRMCIDHSQGYTRQNNGTLFALIQYVQI
jgi:uncharacterized protein with FMN-binding domain